MQLDRRSLLKGAGAAGAGLVAPSTVSAKVGEGLDTTSGELQEAIVVFHDRGDVDRLEALDLVKGYHAFAALPFGYSLLTGEQLSRVAAWSEVLYVHANHEMDYHNDDAREVTGAKAVHEQLYYTGSTVHAAVIDSGIDGDHPDFANSLQANYQFLNPLDTENAMWTDVGPVDSGRGHGTHVSGSLAGEGTASDGQYKGMAPDADLTVYSTDGGASLLQIVGAYDHLVENQRQGRHDIQVVNNSYGATGGHNYSPFGALQLATWAAFEEGITPVFSAGNSYDHNTLGDYSIGPHILCSAATDDDRYVTEFSSKGRRDQSYAGAGDDPQRRGGPYQTPDYDRFVNYDRGEAMANLRELYRKKDVFQGEPISQTTFSGTLGPYVDTTTSLGGVGAGSVTHEWTAPSAGDTGSDQEGVGFVEISLSWQPTGQDIDLFLHEGGPDGPVVGFAAGFVTSNPETVRAPVTPGQTYTIEVAPFENVLSVYDISVSGYEALAEQPSRPFGLHRPSVGTPGKFVMSCASFEDESQAYPTIWHGQGVAINVLEGDVPPPALFKLQREQTEQADDPYYGQLSGTSMSGPVLAGLVALIYDAYKQNHPAGEWPDPIDVINTVEATAKTTITDHPDDARWAHRTYTIGTGFADIDAAVRIAEDAATGAGSFPGFEDVVLADEVVFGDATEVAFDVTGSREDGGDVFTAGQTVHVELSVDASTAATVRDRIPFDWTVEAPDPAATDGVSVYAENGARYIEFSGVEAPETDGETATVDYLLEAPESTDQYQFGPAQAKAEGGDGAFLPFTPTDTNRVVGVDQNDSPL